MPVGDTGVISSATSFTCDQGAAPPVDRLKKLTSDQYGATLSDLLSFALGGDSAAAEQVVAETSSLKQLPKDVPASVDQDLHGSFRRLDQTLQQGLASARLNAVLFGVALPMAYAPVLSITGDFYEMASVIVSRVIHTLDASFALEIHRFSSSLPGGRSSCRLDPALALPST